jgi:hypothetical protein
MCNKNALWYTQILGVYYKILYVYNKKEDIT